MEVDIQDYVVEHRPLLLCGAGRERLWRVYAFSGCVSQGWYGLVVIADAVSSPSEEAGAGCVPAPSLRSATNPTGAARWGLFSLRVALLIDPCFGFQAHPAYQENN